LLVVYDALAEGVACRAMRRLKMIIGSVEITARLRDTPTADAIYGSLPFTSSARTWGDEVYFRTPVSVSR
jgi:uncharacterized protein